MGFRTAAIGRGREKEKLAKDLGAHVYIDGTVEDAGAALQRMGGDRAILASGTSSSATRKLYGQRPGWKLEQRRHHRLFARLANCCVQSVPKSSAFSSPRSSGRGRSTLTGSLIPRGPLSSTRTSFHGPSEPSRGTCSRRGAPSLLALSRRIRFSRNKISGAARPGGSHQNRRWWCEGRRRAEIGHSKGNGQRIRNLPIPLSILRRFCAV
jgi:hypothetical protein